MLSVLPGFRLPVLDFRLLNKPQPTFHHRAPHDTLQHLLIKPTL